VLPLELSEASCDLRPVSNWVTHEHTLHLVVIVGSVVRLCAWAQFHRGLHVGVCQQCVHQTIKPESWLNNMGEETKSGQLASWSVQITYVSFGFSGKAYVRGCLEC
jgi:hypothetical protein